MARLPRLSVADYPHHVIQRGNNGQAIFAEPADYQCWLDLLQESAARYAVSIHAWVLMESRVHLLATPQTKEGLPLMMQAIGRRYVRYFNTARQRTGTLWEGRYRCTVLQASRHLVNSMVWMDLSPVRAALVESPEMYPWSSHAHYLGLKTEKWVTPHALFWQLGNTPFAREEAYAQRVREGMTPVQWQEIADASLKGWALGDAGFIAELQKHTDRRLTKAKTGRPPLPV